MSRYISIGFKNQTFKLLPVIKAFIMSQRFQRKINKETTICKFGDECRNGPETCRFIHLSKTSETSETPKTKNRKENFSRGARPHVRPHVEHNSGNGNVNNNTSSTGGNEQRQTNNFTFVLSPSSFPSYSAYPAYPTLSLPFMPAKEHVSREHEAFTIISTDEPLPSIDIKKQSDVKSKPKPTGDVALPKKSETKSVLNSDMGVPVDPQPFTVIRNRGMVKGDEIPGDYSNSCMFISIATLLCFLEIDTTHSINDLTIILRKIANFPDKSIYWDQAVRDHEDGLMRICKKYKIGINLFTVNYLGANGSSWIGKRPFVTYNMDGKSKNVANISIAAKKEHFEPIISKTSVSDEVKLPSSSIPTVSFKYKPKKEDEKKSSLGQKDIQRIIGKNVFDIDIGIDIDIDIDIVNKYYNHIEDLDKTEKDFPNHERRLASYRDTVDKIKNAILEVEKKILKLKMDLLEILKSNLDLSKNCSSDQYRALVYESIIPDPKIINEEFKKNIANTEALKKAFQLQLKNFEKFIIVYD
jgi:hypothetical protein